MLLDDVGDRAISEPCGLHMAAAADRTEDRPFGDFCGVQPCSQRDYGARYFTGDDGNDSAAVFLVGLGATNG